MGLIVQKYGGTSVGNIERIRNVANRIIKTYNQGHDVVVVLSAMSGVTDNLISMAHQASKTPSKRELDVLMATGEQTTIALMSMTLQDMGYPSASLLGFQADIITDSMSTKARIMSIGSERIKNLLSEKKIVVIAGFQGIDPNGNITTLGRGGSDTSDRKSTRLNSSHNSESRMPSSA
jgi:aspartate kinase